MLNFFLPSTYNQSSGFLNCVSMFLKSHFCSLPHPSRSHPLGRDSVSLLSLLLAFNSFPTLQLVNPQWLSSIFRMNSKVSDLFDTTYEAFVIQLQLACLAIWFFITVHFNNPDVFRFLCYTMLCLTFMSFHVFLFPCFCLLSSTPCKLLLIL